MAAGARSAKRSLLSTASTPAALRAAEGQGRAGPVRAGAHQNAAAPLPHAIDPRARQPQGPARRGDGESQAQRVKRLDHFSLSFGTSANGIPNKAATFLRNSIRRLVEYEAQGSGASSEVADDPLSIALLILSSAYICGYDILT